MLRRWLNIILVIAAITLAAVGAWSRATENVTGGWMHRLGKIEFAHGGYGEGLVVTWGVRNSSPTIAWSIPRPFGYYRGKDWLTIVAPYWSWVAVLLAYPLCSFIRYQVRSSRMMSRRIRHACLNCGYSLSGIRSKRCPECGAPVAIEPVSKRAMFIHQIRGICSVCLAFGMGTAVACWMTSLSLALAWSPYFRRSNYLSQLLSDIPEVFWAGLLTGTVWSIIAVPLLHRRDVSGLARRLAYIIPVFVLVTIFVDGIGPFLLGNSKVYVLVALMTPFVAFAIMCFYVRHTAPAAPGLSEQQCA